MSSLLMLIALLSPQLVLDMQVLSLSYPIYIHAGPNGCSKEGIPMVNVSALAMDKTTRRLLLMPLIRECVGKQMDHTGGKKYPHINGQQL